MLLCDPSIKEKITQSLTDVALETGLKANANQGSPLYDRMTNLFKLNTRIWEGFQLSLSHAGRLNALHVF